MKRFFSRFSAAAPTSQTKSASDASFDRSEKQDVGGPSPAILAPCNNVGRTKALVAKFEGAAPTSSLSSQVTTNVSPAPPLTIPRSSAESPLSDVPIAPSQRALPTSAARSVLTRIPGSSLPAEASQSSQYAALNFGSEANHPQQTTQGKDQRHPSSGSQTTSSTTHANKTVAFAPSPQKQRSTSPAQLNQLQRISTASPVSRTNSNETNPSTTCSSFARPTAASQARSRTWTRSATSDTSQHIPSAGAHSLREKSSSSYARQARASYAPPARSTTRRSYSYSSGPASRDDDPVAAAPAFSNAANRIGEPPLSIARRTSLDIMQNGRGPPSNGADPAGPLQFPTRSTLAMRMGNSGTGGSRSESRRNSVDPTSPTGSNEPVIFPHSGAAATRSFGFPTWSEMTHEELVRNLGPRERTRQEVLWEIVASEERYVTELEKAKEIYIDALVHPEHFDPERFLPPALSSTATAPTDVSGPRDKSSTLQPALLSHSSTIADSPNPRSGPTASGDLPIAARFMSNVSAGKGAPTYQALRQVQSQWDSQYSAGARSPYSVGVSNTSAGNAVARPDRMPNRIEVAYGLGLGLGTMATRDRSAAAYMNAPATNKGKAKVSKAQKLRAFSGKADGNADPLRLSVPLPPSLREVLGAMSEGLVEAHGLLSDALKARYEEQWPLVRSLADVFMKYSHILEHYASYVCHLQRAMEELEEAALMERAFRGKRLKKERLSNTVGLGRTVAALEACASEQGYGGLSIFASMPFQRLLKYPLLFQNLLFHTDPSTHEFESTVAMVVEVERLVRSIEDEKVNAEERDKLRDVFARIDGITDRQVLRPRSDRLLIEEKALYDQHALRTLSESAPKDGRGEVFASDSEGGESGTESSSQRGGRWSNSGQSGLRAALRNKRSYRRLSDFLSSEDAANGSSKAPAMGSKKDLWLVRFSDVEIKCQRIGVTALPMVSTAALRSADDAELETNDFTARSKDSRERLKALRNTTLRAKTRNLYKFVSVVAWRNAAVRHMDDGKECPTDGLPTSHEVDEEEDEDDDDGDSVSSDDSTRSSGSSSGSSSDGVGGQAGSDKYIRTTKLSFTYWGDRIEPGRALTGVQASGTTNSQVKATVGDRKSHTRGSQRHSAASTDSATTAASIPISDAARARQPRRSHPNDRTRPNGISGMSGRLSEPLAATSMSSAPESMQTAVAQMHARQRNEKFGARLRTALPSGMAGVGEASGSHVSVNLADGASNRRGSATALPREGD